MYIAKFIVINFTVYITSLYLSKFITKEFTITKFCFWCKVKYYAFPKEA